MMTDDCVRDRPTVIGGNDLADDFAAARRANLEFGFGPGGQIKENALSSASRRDDERFVIRRLDTARFDHSRFVRGGKSRRRR